MRSTPTQKVEAEADSYQEDKAPLEAQIPEGWQLHSVVIK